MHRVEKLTDTTAILHSKRANVYYLEKCRVIQKDGRVLYLTEGLREQEFREQCLQVFTQHKALEFMFNKLKDAAIAS